ncbi:MAG: B12-binding domain-containing radical SAM protein [Promethearchaeia archaeon]
MKVALINPPSENVKNSVKDLLYGCWCQGKRIGGSEFPPLNLLYIATVLNKEHIVKVVIVKALKLNYNDLIKYLAKFDCIIIPTTSFCYNEDVNFLSKIKKINKNIITIIFGQYPTFYPESSLVSPFIDFSIIGEPEFIIKNLLNKISNSKNLKFLRNIKGLCYREKNKIINTGRGEFIQNLDDLPIPDRNYIKKIYFFNPLVKNREWTAALTSRGCPAKCNFCLSPEFYGKIYRFQSPKRMIDEIEYLQSEGYKEIFYRDETFTGNLRRTEKFCKEIIKNRIELDWICNVRVGTVNRKILRLMKLSGCHYIKIGVESGSQLILNNLNKNITLKNIQKTFNIAHEINLKTHAHIILGAPGETIKTIDRTIKFVKILKPTTVTFNLFTPFPGTKIFKILENNFIKDFDKTSMEFQKCLISPSILSKYYTELDYNFLNKLIPFAYKKFYLRIQYILSQIKELKSIFDFNRIIKSGINVIEFMFGNESKLNFNLI